MCKRIMMLLLTGMLIATVGCGNKADNSEEITGESAVEESTADSDSIETESENEEELNNVEDEAESEQTVFEEAELACSLPDGFEPHPDEEGLYVYKTYPKDISTISYVISESDEDISDISKEAFKEMLEADYMEAYGDEVIINITEFKDIKVDGRKGLRIMLDCEFKGQEYEQLMYILFNGNEAHILNFTQEKGGKWMDEFLACGDSLTFE